MEERDFFDERPEQRTHTMTCPHCGQQGEYELGWIVRRKKSQVPRGADERATWFAGMTWSAAKISAAGSVSRSPEFNR
jgi:hypothetical protein